MKFVKLLCLFLVLAMMLTMFSACAENDENEVDDTVSDDTVEGVVGIFKKNYNADFTILSPNGGLFDNYYWSEEVGTSSISKANFEREMAIEEHLGIEIYHESFNIGHGVLYEIMEQAILAGLDEYQLVLTHSFQDLVTLMSMGYLLDLSDVQGISLNEEYWNTNIMEAVKFQGHMYLGSSSFILHKPTVILFNKTMADSFPEMGSDKLYQHVRDKTWTLEQMKLYASMVNISANNTLAPIDGTYGFISHINWEMCSFPTASGYFHVSIDNDGIYQLQGFNENIFDMFKEIVAITDSDYFYGWTYEQADKAISMDSGRALFGTAGVEAMIEQMINSDIPLGVLPYPTVEAGMTAQNLDWAGYFCIPSVVVESQMSGEVVEMLSYYGETEIKHEFYDVLLGLRASNAPQDREMLELIFDNLAAEPALAFLNRGDSKLAMIFYVIPYMIGSGEKAMTSWYAREYNAAKKQLNEVNE